MAALILKSDQLYRDLWLISIPGSHSQNTTEVQKPREKVINKQIQPM